MSVCVGSVRLARSLCDSVLFARSNKRHPGGWRGTTPCRECRGTSRTCPQSPPQRKIGQQCRRLLLAPRTVPEQREGAEAGTVSQTDVVKLRRTQCKLGRVRGLDEVRGVPHTTRHARSDIVATLVSFIFPNEASNMRSWNTSFTLSKKTCRSSAVVAGYWSVPVKWAGQFPSVAIGFRRSSASKKLRGFQPCFFPCLGHRASARNRLGHAALITLGVCRNVFTTVVSFNRKAQTPLEHTSF